MLPHLSARYACCKIRFLYLVYRSLILTGHCKRSFCLFKKTKHPACGASSHMIYTLTLFPQPFNFPETVFKVSVVSAQCSYIAIDALNPYLARSYICYLCFKQHTPRYVCVHFCLKLERGYFSSVSKVIYSVIFITSLTCFSTASYTLDHNIQAALLNNFLMWKFKTFCQYNILMFLTSSKIPHNFEASPNLCDLIWNFRCVFVLTQNDLTHDNHPLSICMNLLPRPDSYACRICPNPSIL